MKKTISILITVIISIGCLFCFSACSTNTERYNLSKIDFSTITVDHYDYNYIEFDFDKGTYILKNRVQMNGIVTKQTGNFTVDDNNNITFTNDNVPSQNYILYDNEKAYFEGNEFHVEANISGYGDVYMIFEK